MPLTPANEKKILILISKYLEHYYVLKHLSQYEELLTILPVPYDPVPPRPYDQSGWAGYTPNPDDPDPDPWPWPGPPPWWRVGVDAHVIDMLDSLEARLGRILGDPNPQPDLVSTVREREFHLKSAEAALESLDKARSALKENVVALKSQ